MEKTSKKHRGRKIINIILITLAVITFLWLSLLIYNYYRTKTDRRPILCFNYVEEVENTTEYTKTCYGILYKYREYYNKDSDSMTARELTLFFRDFVRDSNYLRHNYE